MQLIHLGYPKCASTSLQKLLFNNQSFGFRSPCDAPCIRLLHDLKAVDTFEFDKKINDIRKNYVKLDDGFISVYSHEHLLIDPYGEGSAVREGVRRLTHLFDNPKIFLLIREQKSVIISSYNEHLRRGWTTKFEDFINTKERVLGFRPSVCRLDEFRYDSLIAYLHQAFGSENVLVLPVEMIKEPRFLKRLYGFLDKPLPPGMPEIIDINSRKSRRSDLIFLPIFNRLITPGPPHSGSILRKSLYLLNLLLSPFVPKSLYKAKLRKFHKMYDIEIGKAYSESNKKTSELIGIDLKSFGYE